ncbi:MAG: hypothetical protein OEW36_06795 [Hylemonella sp.]|nr:hypothetical protein [Hylemonella sp.]
MIDLSGIKVPHPGRGFHSLHRFILGLVVGGIVGAAWWGMRTEVAQPAERLPLLVSTNGLEISLLEGVRHMRNILSFEDRDERERELSLLLKQRSQQDFYLSQLNGATRSHLQLELLGVLRVAHASYAQLQAQFLAQVRAGELNAAGVVLDVHGQGQLVACLELLARMRESERRLLDHVRQNADSLQDLTKTLLQAVMAASLLIGVFALIRARQEDRDVADAEMQGNAWTQARLAEQAVGSRRYQEI